MTFEDMQKDVLYRLDGSDLTTASSDLITMVKQWLNEAQRVFCGEFHWPFLEEADTFSTVASQEAYGLPSDFNQMLFLYQKTSPSEVTYLTEMRFRMDIPDPTATGNPLYYRIFESSMNLYPIPSAIITMYRNYLKTPTVMSALGDVGSVPATYQAALVYYALAIAKEQDDEDGSVYLDRYYDLREAAKRHYSRKERGVRRLENKEAYEVNPLKRLDLPIVSP